jgi:hypothetical protein
MLMISILFLSSLFLSVQIHAMDPIPRMPQAQARAEASIKVRCSDGTTDMPMSIISMSETLTDMITIHGERNNILYLKEYSCATVKGLVTNIKKFDNALIDAYSLEILIEMTKLFEYLVFSKNESLVMQWKHHINKRIYLQCRDMSWEDLQSLAPGFLSGDLVGMLFCDPIIARFKFELIKKVLKNGARRIELSTGGTAGSAFSRDGKMIAIMLGNYRGNGARITIIFPEGDKHTSYQLYDLAIHHVWLNTGQFSSDGKKFIIGNEEGILLYDINDEGVLNKDSVQKLSDNITFNTDLLRPPQQIVLNADSTEMVAYDGFNLLLWHLGKNGINEDRSKVLLEDILITSPIKFSDDGTILVMTKRAESASILYQFKNGRRVLQLALEDVSGESVFYSHTKKFVTFRKSDESLYVYNFEDKDSIVSDKIISLGIQEISFEPTSIILDDTALIIRSYRGLQMIDIYENNRETIGHLDMSDICHFAMAPDNSKIIFTRHAGPYTLYTLLTPEEEEALASIKNIDVKNMWLIGRILRGIEYFSAIEPHELPDELMSLLERVCESREKKPQESKKSNQRGNAEKAALKVAWAKNSGASSYDQEASSVSQNELQDLPEGFSDAEDFNRAQALTPAQEGQAQEKDTPAQSGIFKQILSGIFSIPSSIFSIVKFAISALISLFSEPKL